MDWSRLLHQGEESSLIYHSWLFMRALNAACMLISSHGSIMWVQCYYFMFWYTHFSFMMMSIVNGVCEGSSFLFAKLWASGPDEMTMWWLSARCCHFSHDFLMLFSHGSPPRNDKQMPNAFMDVIFLPSHSLPLHLYFILPRLFLSLCFKSHFFLLLYSLRFSLSSCRCCVWSRLQ